MSRNLKSSLIVALFLLSGEAVHGQGLTGEYFENAGLIGSPTLTRIENVNFNWGAEAPDASIPADNFSVRWTGSLLPPETGAYTFSTRSDDGVNLWVDGQQIISNWTAHSAILNKSQELQLEAGEPVAIKLEYYESGGDAVIELYWAGPGIDEQIIPAEYLSPTTIRNLQARQPSPANGALDFNPQAPLFQWSPGETAKYHNVYLGLDPNLTDADRVAMRLSMTSYFHFIYPLMPGTTYYWRVDEIEKDLTTIHTGKVWSFTAQAETAYYPLPTDGATDALVAPTLTWLSGVGSIGHHLYFGDNLDAVTEGAADTDKGKFALDDTGFTPDPLDQMTTYYWRVDETLSDETIVPGPVWNFTTCLPIDDFEIYTDDDGNRIYQTWTDGPVNGTGSLAGYFETPFAESIVVHGGFQSLPMDFNNIDEPYYSEIEREYTTTQDWTANGANTLVLYLRGKLLNPPAQLYVALQDSSNHFAAVNHSDLEITKSLTWTAWKIPLSEFTGVSANRIKKIYIGVGDRTTPVQGGNGLIFIDDICAAKEPPAPEAQ